MSANKLKPSSSKKFLRLKTVINYSFRNEQVAANKEIKLNHRRRDRFVRERKDSDRRRIQTATE